MEHCVKVVLDDVCAKTLQQEEALYSSGHTSLTLCRTTGHNANAAGNTPLREDSFYTHSERETPKMIAKVLSGITWDSLFNSEQIWLMTWLRAEFLHGALQTHKCTPEEAQYTS